MTAKKVRQSQPGRDEALETLKAGWQRTQADFDNAQRRWEEERRALRELVAVDTLLEVAPALDNFDRAFAHLTDKHASWAAGFQHIAKQLGDILTAHGLERIATVGQHFDPTKHEAVMEEASPQPEGTIIRDVEGGYTHRGRVVRPARVVVSKGEAHHG